MFIRYLFLLFCVAVFAVVFTTNSTMAAGNLLSLSDVKELDYRVSISKEEFENNTDLYSAVPNKEKYLAYEMRLPKRWRKVSVHGLDIKLSKKILTEIAEYYGPPKNGRRSSFRVSAMKIDGVMSLEHWYVNYVITNAFTLQGFKKINDNRVEGLYVVLDNGISYVVRTVAIFNGSYLIVAEYRTPIEIYEMEKNNLILSINSFRMQNQVSMSNVESVNYSFLDIMELDYPSNWFLKKATIDSMDYMYMLLAYGDQSSEINLSDNISMKGRIEIKLFSKSSDPDPFIELSKTHMKFEDYGFVIDVKDKKLDYDNMSPGFKITHSELMYLSHESGSYLDYELWDVIIDSKDYIIVMQMISPAREDDFNSWARNIGTLKFIIESLR